MDSVIDNLLKNKTSVHGSTNYLKPSDFKLDEPVKLRIIGGNPSRTFWENNKVTCRSHDGISGDMFGLCEDCKFMKGVGKGDDRVYCTLKIELHASTSPALTTVFTIPYRAQQNLHTYVKGLLDRGLDIPDVYTDVTKVEDIGGYPTYIFSMNDMYDTSDSEVAISAHSLQLAYVLRDDIRADADEMKFDEFAKILMKADKTLTDAAALQIAEKLGENGVVR